MQFYCDHMSRLGSIADYYVTKVAAAAHGRTWASWRATATLRWARMPGGRQQEGPAGARASLKAHTGSVCAVYAGPWRGRAPLRGAWAFQKAAPPSLPLASRLGAVWREGGRWLAGCLHMGDSGQLGESGRWLQARGRHALGRGRGQAEERARKERGSDRREMARLRKRAGRRAAAGCTEWARGTGHEGGGERDAGEGREAMRDVGGGRC